MSIKWRLTERSRCLAMAVLSCGLLACGPSRVERFIELGSAIPGFGGLSRDGSDGVWTVYTRDSSQTGAAEVEITRIFGHGGPDSFVVSVRPSRGDASEAMKNEAANAVASVASVSSVYYDELTGYVRVGFSDPDAILSVEGALRDGDVPIDSVILHVRPALMLP